MHKYIDSYPPAPQTRVDDAKRLFPYTSMSPEEYAAREGDAWMCFSFDDYIYEDAKLNEWIHTLGDIFFMPGRLDAAKKKFGKAA